jgi:hypothetical protein
VFKIRIISQTVQTGIFRAPPSCITDNQSFRMNRPPPPDDSARFRGGLRPHHRTGSTSQSSWEEWVAEERAGRPQRNWLKIIGGGFLVVIVIAIGVAIFIEMR